MDTPRAPLAACVCQAATILFRACEARAETIRTTLDLLSLRVGMVHGLCAVKSSAPTRGGGQPAATVLREQFAALCPYHDPIPTCLCDDALAKAWGALDAIPPDACVPGSIGLAYEQLHELSFSREMEPHLKHHRRTKGAYYTPTPIIRQILDGCVKDWSSRPTLCDPSAGTGFFLLDALAEAGQHMSRDELGSWVATSLCGVDRDPHAIHAAQSALSLACRLLDPDLAFPLHHLRVGDALLGPVWDGSAARVQQSLWTAPAPVPPPAPAPAPSTATPSDRFDWEAAFPHIAQNGGFDVVFGNPPYDVLTRFARHPELAAYARALRASRTYPLSMHGQINLYRCFLERGLHLVRPGGRMGWIVPSGFLLDHVAAPLRKAFLQHHHLDAVTVFPECEAVFSGVTQAVTILHATRDAGRAARISVHHPRGTVTPTTDQIVRLTPDYAIPAAPPEAWTLLAWLEDHAPRRLIDEVECGVGEVDQTIFRNAMRDEDTGHLLVRGSHVRPFLVDLLPLPSKERFLDRDEFITLKKGAAQASLARVAKERVVQLGIRNMASRPRMVAGILPPGVFAGNSVNVLSPKRLLGCRALCGLLNSRLYDWRFCLTSGNNNINVREVESLPLPDILDQGLLYRIEDAVRACQLAAESEGDLAAARLRLDEAVYDLFALPPSFRTWLTTDAGT